MGRTADGEGHLSTSSKRPVVVLTTAMVDKACDFWDSSGWFVGEANIAAVADSLHAALTAGGYDVQFGEGVPRLQAETGYQ